MINRIWHGYTTLQNATAYEHLLKTEVFPNIINKAIPGFRKIELLKRDIGNEVEFITMMLFDSLGDIKSFAGEDYETAVVPAPARALLKRFDSTSRHYEVLSM